MKVALIGATGQIGYALANALAATPHEVSVLVRSAKLPMPPNVGVKVAATFTPEVFADVLAGVDAVIYGAGVPVQPTFDNDMWDRINYGLFETFLGVLAKSPVRRLVYISTCEIFKPVNGVMAETNPLVDVDHVSRYRRAMVHAYQAAQKWAAETGGVLTTIHPTAVYGGINTGSMTGYIESLFNSASTKVPMIVEGRFPVVHVESLAAAVIASLNCPGAYLIADETSSLKGVALVLKTMADSYVPPVAPEWLVRSAAGLSEMLTSVTHKLPVMTRGQIDFLTQSGEAKTERAQQVLGWKPVSLEAGMRKYMQDRERLLALVRGVTAPA